MFSAILYKIIHIPSEIWLDIPPGNRYNNHRSEGFPGKRAGVMELADVTDSKSVGLITRVGSSPTAGIAHGKTIRVRNAGIVFLLKESPKLAFLLLTYLV